MSIAAAVVLVGAGCGTTAPQTPESTVRAYIEAVRQDDPVRAGALRTAKFEPVGDESERARAIEPVRVRERERSAEWGVRAALVQERLGGDSGWRVRAGVLTSFSALSPEACLDRLVQAISTRDVRLLESLLPREFEGVFGRRELEAILLRPQWAALSAGISARAIRWVSKDANRAEGEVVIDGETHTLVLAREGLVWKVFDVRPWKGYLPR